MTVEITTIYLLDVGSGDSVESELRDAIEDAQLVDWQTKWQPALIAVLQELFSSRITLFRRIDSLLRAKRFPVAFTVTNDRVRQEQVWESLARSCNKEPYQVRIGEHSFRQCRCGRSATSPQALLLAERIVCNKTKAIGARRCNTILINAGVEPSDRRKTLGRRRTLTFVL
jgi:hypothetical protein